MKLFKLMIAGALWIAAGSVWAGDKLEAAVGGAAGGAVGAVVGDEIGDRKGAIIGAAVGAAVGTAIATDGNDKPPHDSHDTGHVHVGGDHHHGHSHGYHCPPGQAKKGRC